MWWAIAFWASLGGILYTYLAYPLLLCVLAKARRGGNGRQGGEARTAPGGEVPLPAMTLLVTVRNERRQIAAKLKDCLALDYPPHLLQLLVASDGSDDGTDEVVRGGFGDRVELVSQPQPQGKEFAQKGALGHARGDIVVFTDAATRMDADCLIRLAHHFADPGVGCVSSRDAFIDAAGKVSGEGLYVRYEMALRRLESRVAGLVGLSGSLFAVRRELCTHLSGKLQSDFSLLLASVRAGSRGVLAEDCVGFYPDLAERQGEFSRKVRTVVRGLTVFFCHLDLLNPLRYGLFTWQLISHKLMRWLIPFLGLIALAACLALARGSRTFQAVLALSLLGCLAALVARHLRGGLLVRILVPFAYLLETNAAVLVAWLRYLSGRRIVRWDPSRR